MIPDINVTRCTVTLSVSHFRVDIDLRQGRISRGIHGFYKVSLGYTMPYHSMVYALSATLKTALWPFQGWLPAGLVACSRLTTRLDTPCHAPLTHVCRLLTGRGRSPLAAGRGTRGLDGTGRGGGRRSTLGGMHTSHCERKCRHFSEKMGW
jgi:hypothetical protein